MGLNTRENSPDGKIVRMDVSVAKIYLKQTEFEKYRIVQDRLFQSDFDRFLEALPFEGEEPEKPE